jgi:hypothetical protein
MNAEKPTSPALYDLTDREARVDACPRLGRRSWQAMQALTRVTYRPELREDVRRLR